MLIAAFLPQPLLRHLQRAITPDHDVVAVSSWNVLRDVVRTSGAEVAVIDPSAEPSTPVSGVPAHGIDIVEFIAAIVPVVVYAVLTPRTARFMSHTNASAVRQLVLHGIDDDPERLRQIIEGLGATDADTVLVRPIIAAISASGAPPALGAAIRLLFRTPRRFRSAEDLAIASGLSRRWVNECLAAAGLAPARILVIAARVWRAYHDLRMPGTSVGSVAARLSYPDIKSSAGTLAPAPASHPRNGTPVSPPTSARHVSPLSSASPPNAQSRWSAQARPAIDERLDEQLMTSRS